jgi:hypothetical protein
MFRATRTITYASLTVCLVVLVASPIAAAEGPLPPLVPVVQKAIAERVKTLTEEAPKGATLVAFLDCGSQAETAKDSPVGIKKVKGEPYRFPADGVEVLPTQPTVFFDADRVLFELNGIDRTGRYLVGLTWWDFDAGGRTQMVMVASHNKRNVRIAVPAIGLPDYMNSKKLPAQKQFTLPATFAKDGKMQLAVIQAAGPNAVISELWIWQLKK